MMYRPFVSILINNYNYGAYLAQAIDSALDQTYGNIEIIVVDDGSTDDSRRIIKWYDGRISSVLKANGGQASAFNVGFARSQGEIILLLDSDDIFVSNKVEKIVDAFEGHGEAGWCMHPLKLMDGDLVNVVGQASTGLSGVYDVRTHLRRGKLAGTLPFAGTATSGLCFARSLLAEILPMPLDITIGSDDYVKYAALGLSPGYVLLEPLAVQRIHGNNAYTLRKDKEVLRSQITMLTAYHLRHNVPEVARFANNIFAMAWGRCRRHGSGVAETQRIVGMYLACLALGEGIKVRLRMCYHWLKADRASD